MPPTIEPVGPPEQDERQENLLSRLGWFALLWLGGATTVAAVAYALRALMGLN